MKESRNLEFKEMIQSNTFLKTVSAFATMEQEESFLELTMMVWLRNKKCNRFLFKY